VWDPTAGLTGGLADLLGKPRFGEVGRPVSPEIGQATAPIKRLTRLENSDRDPASAGNRRHSVNP